MTDDENKTTTTKYINLDQILKVVLITKLQTFKIMGKCYK